MKNKALENEKKILLKSQQSYESNKNIIGSISSEFPGMNLKGSIIPEKVPLGKIKEEGDNFDENEIGEEYISDDDEGNENKINIFKKEKEKQIKKSRLKISLNSNIFDFTDKNDENYVTDLKNEINDLYKIRDDLNDQITLNKETISKKDEEFKTAQLKNEELQKIIIKKDEEFKTAQLKNEELQETISKKDEELKTERLKNDEFKKIIEIQKAEIDHLKNIWDESS